jgi:hypothetical protein
MPVVTNQTILKMIEQEDKYMDDVLAVQAEAFDALRNAKERSLLEDARARAREARRNCEEQRLRIYSLYQRLSVTPDLPDEVVLLILLVQLDTERMWGRSWRDSVYALGGPRISKHYLDDVISRGAPIPSRVRRAVALMQAFTPSRRRSRAKEFMLRAA